MFSLDARLFSPQPQLPWAEGSRGGANDTLPAPANWMSGLGESLLIPLGHCGHHWQLLQSEKGQGTLHNVWSVFRKIFLVVPTLIAFVPGIVGALLKKVSNPPLMQDGCYHTWELEASPLQQEKCHQLGLYDFNRSERQISNDYINLSKQHPEFLKLSSVYIPQKLGHENQFSRTVSLSLFTPWGLARPNSNDFMRNIVNCFRPSIAPRLELRQIKVLEDLLLGIKSGTNEDYRRLQEHLAFSTKIELTTHWDSDTNYNFGRRINLKIFY